MTAHDNQVHQDQAGNDGRDRRRDAPDDREDHHDDRKPPGPASEMKESDADPDPNETEHENDRTEHARGQAESGRKPDAYEDERGDEEEDPQEDDQHAYENRQDREDRDTDGAGPHR